MKGWYRRLVSGRAYYWLASLAAAVTVLSFLFDLSVPGWSDARDVVQRDAPIVSVREPADEMALRLASDLNARLYELWTCNAVSIEVAGTTRQETRADEASHGFDALFVQSDFYVISSGTRTHLLAAGSGRGPARETDAYASLLQNAIEKVEDVTPRCFRRG